MNCLEAQHWLYSAQREDPLPSVLRQHLKICRNCQRLRRRLLRLDEEVQNLPVPKGSTAAREQLLKKIEKLAQPSAPPQRRQWRVSRQTLRTALGLAAAILVFVTGWFAGRYAFTPDKGPSDTKELKLAGERHDKREASSSALLVKVAHFDVELAETTEPRRHLEILSGMLDELHAATFRYMGQGALEKVTETAQLYGQILHHGIEPRFAALPKENRQKVLPALLDKLAVTESKIAQVTKKTLPLVKEVLHPLQAATQQTARRLKHPRPVVNDPQPLSLMSSSLLAILVYQGLKLANEVDPVQRAELCAELAPIFANAVVMLSANGDTNMAQALGKSLGDLVEKGMEKNLKLVADPKSKQLQQSKAKCQQSVEQSLSTLRENWQHAAPATRAGMRQALDSAASGLDIDKKKPQEGNGPPWLRDKTKRPGKGRGKGKPFLPPGWLKKLSGTPRMPTTHVFILTKRREFHAQMEVPRRQRDYAGAVLDDRRPRPRQS